MSASLVQTVGDFLVEKNWAFGQDQSTGIYCFKILHRSVLIPCEVGVNDDVHVVLVSTYFLPQVPLRWRKNMLEFVSAANFQLVSGGLEIGKTGYVRYRETLVTQGLTITADFIDAFLIRVLENTVKLRNGVLAVLNGDRAGDALNMINEKNKRNRKKDVCIGK
jgi:hypothetical protein